MSDNSLKMSDKEFRFQHIMGMVDMLNDAIRLMMQTSNGERVDKERRRDATNNLMLVMGYLMELSGPGDPEGREL